MNTHTPGPWEMETVRTACGICHKIGPFPGSAGRETGHACIYVDYPGNGPKEAELEANARLIAASPELLAACERFMAGVLSMTRDLTFLGPQLQQTGVIDGIRAAIAKAKGNP